MKDISKIYDIDEKELEKQAEEYSKKRCKNEEELESFESAKSLFIANAKAHLLKMKQKTLVKLKQQQKRRDNSKKNRKMSVRNKRRK